MNSSPPSSPPLRAASANPSHTPSRTPNRRAFSADTPSGHISVRTPLDRSVTRDLRASIRRGTPGSAIRSNAPTPHARAARRALDQRRTAMLTPGRNRRRSLMNQRETPMDILRELGKMLAPTSRPVATSSSSSLGDKPSASPAQEDQSKFDEYQDDGEEDLPIDPPRMSLPLGDDDSSSSSTDLRPPRISQIDDDNLTVQSIEMPRRIDNQSAIPRLSRGSPGSVRVSDYYNIDEDDETGQQSDFFPGLLEDLQAGAAVDDDMSFDRIDADQSRRFTMGHESDFNFEIPANVGDQTTFVLSDPAADVSATSPIVGRSVTEAVATEGQEPGGDVVDYSDSDAGGGFNMDDVFDYDAGGVDDHSSINEEEEPLPLVSAAATQVTRVAPSAESEDRSSRTRPAKKRKRISKHGIEYPSLPPAFVKRAAQTALQSSGLSNQRISADALDALTQASDWFFEQLGDDLGAYADHAKRKTIEESDVLTLMRRQRQIGSRSTVFSLAQKHLPRELLQELRMPVPQPVKQRRAKRVQVDQDDDQGDVVDYT